MSHKISQSDSPQAAGRAIYQAVWQIVATDFFDTSRLSDWQAWQNRFDDQIVDSDSGLSFARLMLQSLGDRYTCINVPVAKSKTADCVFNMTSLVLTA